jgi:hypothetical protein
MKSPVSQQKGCTPVARVKVIGEHASWSLNPLRLAWLFGRLGNIGQRPHGAPDGVRQVFPSIYDAS